MRFISETAESWLMVALNLLMVAVSAWFTFSLTSPIADTFHEIERSLMRTPLVRNTSVFGLNKLVTPKIFDHLSLERVLKLEALS